MPMSADDSGLIAVTGRGYVGSAGQNLEEMFERCLFARTGGEWLDISAGGRVCRAPVIPAHHPTGGRRLDRSVQFGLEAARAACREAGGPEVQAVFAGTSRGPVQTLANSVEAGRFPPSDGPSGVVGCLSGAIAAEMGITGMALTVSASCTSSAGAIALAAQQILLGAADVVLAGGAEAPIHPAALGPLAAAGILGKAATPERACRPFDRNRNGTIIGEGAAFIVLERLSEAKARGATVYALLTGWALGSAPGTRVGQESSGATGGRVMQEALDRAGLSSREVGYVNLHGTGTLLNDRCEAAALARIFAGAVPCSSTKAVTGHCMGAASAMESVVALRALELGQIPPSANCFEPDAGSPPGLILSEPGRLARPAVLVASSGFWGTHAALVFRKF